jgi:hypothetical protein
VAQEIPEARFNWRVLGRAERSTVLNGYWWWVQVDLAGIAPRSFSMFQGWVVRMGLGVNCDNSAHEIFDGWPTPPAFAEIHRSTSRS